MDSSVLPLVLSYTTCFLFCLPSPAAVPRAGETKRHRGGEAVPAQKAAGCFAMTECESVCVCMCVFLPEIRPEPDLRPAGLFEDVTDGSAACLLSHSQINDQWTPSRLCSWFPHFLEDQRWCLGVLNGMGLGSITVL